MIRHNAEIPAVCPMTDIQKGVYFECLNEPESVKYNIAVRCRLPMDTDIARFREAVLRAAALHPILSVTLGAPNGIPSMIRQDAAFTVTMREAASYSAALDGFVRPFDLEKGPLCRFEICRTPEELLFLYDIHHIIFDGTSLMTFVSQIAEFYDGGSPAEEALTLFDLAAAEQEPADPALRDKSLAFYQQKLGGFESDTKPVSDVLTPEKRSGEGRLIRDTSDLFTAADVLAYTTAHQINENAFFMGAFALALARFSGTKDSFFCTVHHGRADRRLASTVGMFVRTLPLYYEIDDGMKTEDFLRTVYDDFYAAKHATAVSFGELASQYGVNNDISFIYQERLFEPVPMGGGKVDIKLMDIGETPVYMDLMLMKSGDAYETMAHFRRDTYTEELVGGFVKLYLNVVKGLFTAETLGDVALTAADDKACLDAINRTECPYAAEKTVVDLFRAQVAKTPDGICLVCCDKRFTYREVDEITDNMARFLVGEGVGREKVVGVLIPRSEWMLLCSLGVLKAGGAYMPLDPTYPPERLNLMMQDSGAIMLLYAPEFADIITDDFNGQRVSTETLAKLGRYEGELPKPKPDDLFVLLYTSGSTGVPKGVMFNHSNTVVTTEWVKKYYEMDENARVTAYASYGFDAHAYDMYPAVTSGAALHIITEDIRLDFPALRRYFNENGITHTVMTMQIGRQFALMGGLTTLRHISVAGEKLTPLDVPDGFAFYNLYGPTEGSIITSAFRLDRTYKDVPIGKAVDNLKVYVVGKGGKLLPIGATGELWISGPHVTRGYLNRPEKTAEAYGENPFDTDPGYERVYRTGDVVRLLADGTIQFIGRRDAQVKVRGFRVELTEIEEVIRRYPGIRDATVAAFDDPAGGKFVAAYVVSDEAVSAEKLAEFISAEKPPYMVPAVIMQIDKIPLNQNQKVNKRALPVPKRSVGEITPPENERQQQICDIVAGVLCHRDFGITTNLYEAGLTSIGAVKLNVELADAFDVPIRVADIKANDTVRKLDAFIASAAPQKQYEKQADYPLTETQNGVFIESMAAPDTTIYNIPVLIRLGGGVDLARLADAVRKMMDAHPYAKTIFSTDAGGNVRAARRDDAPVTVDVIRAAHLPGNGELVRPFTLLGKPLYRIAVYETDDGNYLFMDFHHIICDGTSVGVMLRDISRSYAGETLEAEVFSGFEAGLEDEAVRNSERHEAARAYWKKCLTDCETGCLPKKEPESDEGGAGSVNVTDERGAGDILTFCRENGVTANAYFNSVFAFVLSRFTGMDTVSYATIFNGRNDSRLAEAVTLLARSVPVVADFTNDAPVADTVRRMQTEMVDSMANDACSFAELSHDYGVKADVMLVYQGDHFDFDSLCGEKAERIELALDAAKAPVSVSVFLKHNRFSYTVEYRRDQYSAAFAEALADAVAEVSHSFAVSRMISDVTMLSEQGRAVYDVLNDSRMETEGLEAHRFFERWAEKTPDAPAVTSQDRTLTYGEMNTSANIIAHALIRLGIGADSVVGTVLERSCEIPLCEMAILKAGGAFMNALPSYPDDRIEFCLRDAGSPCVITTEAIRSARPALFADDKPYRTLTVESLLADYDEADTKNPDFVGSSERLAYCIYTSGSTGNPKGVMIEHRNLSNMIETYWPVEDYYREPCDGASLAICSVSFDASVMDAFLPLCAGRHMIMATEEEYHNPLMLKALIERYRVESMVGTPAFLTSLANLPEFAPVFAQFRTIIVGAEAFPGALYEALRKAAPDLQILNCYGPSECTVSCSYKELHGSRRITIGRSSGNVQMYVFDRYGHVLPPYATGELIIGGDGVGRGYVNLPDRTAASYFTLNGMRAYHSGDYVRLNADGEIDFCGRIDNQVKLRGFRVELDEIEKVMRDFPGVRQSKVLVRNNGSEEYLCGFYTADRAIETGELSAYMKTRLTYYMVPAALMQMEEFPLTQNGKINKKAFPEVTAAVRKTAGRRAAKKSLEQRLCEIFSTVLNTSEVFADDSFFELGGTSITASKVTMILMSEGIEVKYGDIFDHPTPEELAAFIEERDGTKKNAEAAASAATGETIRPTLQYNTTKYAPEVKRESLGNVLLTGAVGFLGIHILRELLTIEDGHIWCLVRRGIHESPEIRLRTMLIYYFSDPFDEAMRDRITMLEADITDDSLEETLGDIPFDTVINCAACVKHFSDSDILERVNVHGVENLIAVCRKKGAKLIQISTTSVPGIHTVESYEKQVRMHENELFVIDDMDNKYAISKYHAELRMLDAIDEGLRGKIIRVGNLMGRHSDGEFQANMETNMFLSGIRGFAVMGKYPISHMTDPMRFSPIDCTARAVVLLAGTNDQFTAFNCDNRYGFDEMKIIDACNANGITILPEADEVYYDEFRQKLGDDRINAQLNGLAAYDIKDAHAVDTDNLFTTNILYRIGFSWPLVDDAYLQRAINSMLTLDYFSLYDDEEN